MGRLTCLGLLVLLVLHKVEYAELSQSLCHEGVADFDEYLGELGSHVVAPDICIIPSDDAHAEHKEIDAVCHILEVLNKV